MAMTEDMDFPRLTPRDDRLQSSGKLFRRPEELTDDQFDLLAAAWAEGALTGDARAELESVMSSIPVRRKRAESFRRLHLTPINENWPGMRSCLRPSPIRVAFRRTILPALMAAAALLALIIMGPAGAKLKTMISPEPSTNPATMTVAEIPASHPIVAVNKADEILGDLTAVNVSHEAGVKAEPVSGIHGRESATRSGRGENQLTANSSTPAGSATAVPAGFPAEVLTDAVEPVRALPLALGYGYARSAAIAPGKDLGMASVNMKEISPSLILREDKNWMLRSISFLASAVTGKKQEIDGYMIANGCITGINTVLGWEMELEQVSNRRGDPVAVSFSSSLLSFTKPLNKTTP